VGKKENWTGKMRGCLVSGRFERKMRVKRVML